MAFVSRRHWLLFSTSWVRPFAVVIGVILASLLHATFNFFILNAGSQQTLLVLTFVWAGVIALLATLEWVKRFAPPSRPAQRKLQ